MSAAPPAPGTRAVPGTLDQVVILARYQLRDFLRGRRLLILYSIVLAIDVIATIVLAHFNGAGSRGDPLGFYSGFWGGGAPIVVVLAAIFFGGDAIAGEFQNRTGYFLMGLPIRRVTVYSGKFVAAMLAALGALGIHFLFAVANGGYYLGSGLFPGALFLSVGLTVLYLLAAMGATFLFSSLFKTGAYGIVLTAILLLIGFDLLQAIYFGLTRNEPWFLISYADAVIGNVFLVPYPAHEVFFTEGGQSIVAGWNPTLGEGSLVMLLYFVGTSLAGLFAFEEQQFT